VLVILAIAVPVILWATAIQSISTHPAYHEWRDRVEFPVDESPLSGSFALEVRHPDVPPFSPGSSVIVPFSVASLPASISVDLGAHGKGSAGFLLTPLGTVAVPIVGVSVGTINLDMTSNLVGHVTVDGPGVASTDQLSWSSLGETQSLTISAPNANGGETITVRLVLSYVLSVGASASVPVLGTQPILPAAPLGELPGSATAEAVIRVSPPFPFAAFGLGVLGLGVIGTVIYFVHKHPRKLPERMDTNQRKRLDHSVNAPDSGDGHLARKKNSQSKPERGPRIHDDVHNETEIERRPDVTPLSTEERRTCSLCNRWVKPEITIEGVEKCPWCSHPMA